MHVDKRTVKLRTHTHTHTHARTHTHIYAQWRTILADAGQRVRGYLKNKMKNNSTMVMNINIRRMCKDHVTSGPMNCNENEESVSVMNNWTESEAGNLYWYSELITKYQSKLMHAHMSEYYRKNYSSNRAFKKIGCLAGTADGWRRQSTTIQENTECRSWLANLVPQGAEIILATRTIW